MADTYPYVETHCVWGNEFKFNIHSFRTEDWYGLAGMPRRAGRICRQC